MDPVGESSDYSRVYRPSKGWTAVFLSCSVICCGLAVFMAWVLFEEERGVLELLFLGGIAAGIAALGIYCVPYLFRYRVTLHANRIEVRKVLKKRSMERAEFLELVTASRLMLGIAVAHGQPRRITRWGLGADELSDCPHGRQPHRQAAPEGG